MNASRKPGTPVDAELFGMVVRDLLYGRHPAQQFGGGGFRPHVDVMVGADDAWIQVELPGVALQDIRIAVHERSVEIAGTRRARQQRRGINYLRVEIEFGTFHRRVDLPWVVDAERVEYRHEHGLLEVHVLRLSGRDVSDSDGGHPASQTGQQRVK